jgi:hypothetical protein
LQSLLRWINPGPATVTPNLAPAGVPAHESVMHPSPIDSRIRRSGHACSTGSRVTPVQRPLRVVRILEAGQPRSQVGRMVISGRLADVCAELDRLVACETACH